MTKMKINNILCQSVKKIYFFIFIFIFITVVCQNEKGVRFFSKALFDKNKSGVIRCMNMNEWYGREPNGWLTTQPD